MRVDTSSRMLTFASAGSARSMTYDANGNMTSVSNTCGTTIYTWDVRNRLIGITGYKPDCSQLTASFTYDALGRRIQKTINGRTIQYVYDGKDIVQEIENGLVSVNYIRTQNIDEPLARIDAATGMVRYYHADALGSIIGLSNESGQEVTQYAYDAFGQVAISGELSDNPFQYTGRENDGTGLYYYRARYYSPELQRFISEDPILKPGNPNVPFLLPALLKTPAMLHAYIYVENNPVNFVDPSGLGAEEVLELLKQMDNLRKECKLIECKDIRKQLHFSQRGQGMHPGCMSCCKALSAFYPYAARQDLYAFCIGELC